MQYNTPHGHIQTHHSTTTTSISSTRGGMHPLDRPWLPQLFSLWTFGWMTGAVKAGAQRQLGADDLLALPSFAGASACTERLWHAWHSKADEQQPSNRTSFFRACLAAEHRALLLAGFFWCIQVAVETVLAYFLGEITRVLERLEAQDNDDDNVSNTTLTANTTTNNTAGYEDLDSHGGGRSDGSVLYYYALAIALLALLQGSLNHLAIFLARRVGNSLRAGTIDLVFRKAFRLHHKDMMDTTVGKITNIISNDVERLYVAPVAINYIWIAPLQTIVAAIYLWHIIGPFCLLGLCIPVLMFPVQGISAKLFAQYRIATAQHRDHRVSIMNQILGGMRVIKMYVWEKPFARLIAAIRKKELVSVRKTQTLRGINITLVYLGTPVMTCLTFVPYALTGHELTAYTVFTSLALLNIVRLMAMYQFPIGIQYFSEMRVSCARIERFLRLPEHVPPDDASTAALPVGSIRLQHATFSWNDGNMGGSRDDGDDDDDEKGTGTGGNSSNGKVDVLHAQQDEQQKKKNSNNNKKKQAMNGDKPVPAGNNTLTDVTLDIKPGMLVGVVGPVGSGKTTLLMGMLRELLPSKGSAGVRGRVSYASQEPWILATTVRENILFGAADDPARRAAVIRACALERDLQLLPGGEQALIGERGVTLSGGQKARVSLARAVYRQADVYLLDDPLSAVDAKVGRVLFEECICGLLAGKTRVLATHQVHHLAKADLVVVLDANGRVAAQGPYKEIAAKHPSALQGFFDADAADSDKHNSRYALPQETFARDTRAQHEDSDSSTTRNNDNNDNDNSGNNDNYTNDNSGNGAHRDHYDQFQHATKRTSDSSNSVVSDDPTHHQDCDPVSTSTTALVDKSMVASRYARRQTLAGDESRQAGDVTLAVYKEYILHTGPKIMLLVTALTVLGTQSLFVGADIVLAFWVDEAQTEGTSDTRLLTIYVILLGVVVAVSLVPVLFLLHGFVNASCWLHDDMFKHILFAPIRFFDTNPIGRILNRFSKDLGRTDDQLAFTFADFVTVASATLVIIFLAAGILPWLLVIVVPLFILFYLLRRRYLWSAREVQRLESVSRSPIYTHFNESLTGLATIRVFDAYDLALQTFRYYQDEHSRAVYMFVGLRRWVAFRLDMLGVAFATCAVFVTAGIRHELEAGLAALAISYALRLPGVIQWATLESAAVENEMTSVERIIEYTHVRVEQQPDFDIDESVAARMANKMLPPSWPEGGGLSFLHMSLKYDKNLPYALKDVTLSIAPGAKVGIVGRTGAGKSSILAALFRLSIDPTLFSGTVRYNLDPFEQYSDADLWAALETVQLKEKVQQMDGGLEGHVQEQGSNFSVGQKQLICLARALLSQRTKILVIDEARPHVEDPPDRLIQHTPAANSRIAPC
ncbi:ABC transporter [Salpingoeca rosetta]|uniref:ABC transporter n=1 Tax=Salpingoeca rosetta (strain ATCC 50818 / BSB-021) TaxID=946362 RepID=F2UNW2_SALR5|nr:ABC transporter [Salpingoeca rosetta]EGD79317.1 ABC transporter [Salpingoeca rosetta]|eukprot:XP_004989086.1 ABC transporter [Salpingoeca rosetta]